MLADGVVEARAAVYGVALPLEGGAGVGADGHVGREGAEAGGELVGGWQRVLK